MAFSFEYTNSPWPFTSVFEYKLLLNYSLVQEMNTRTRNSVFRAPGPEMDAIRNIFLTARSQFSLTTTISVLIIFENRFNFDVLITSILKYVESTYLIQLKIIIFSQIVRNLGKNFCYYCTVFFMFLWIKSLKKVFYCESEG